MPPPPSPAPHRPPQVVGGAAAWLTALLLALGACNPGTADERTASQRTNAFDDRRLPNRPAPPFSFVVAGHIYGRPGAGQPRPATSLTAGAVLLDRPDADLSVLLGDTVYGWHTQQLGDTFPFLRTAMPQPVFNAVGNHERADLTAHRDYFGEPWFAFDHGGCRFVVLDSEADPWLISGEQLQWLLDELEAARLRPTPPRALFLFAHRPVWAMTLDTVLTALLGNAPGSIATLIVGHDGPASFARVVLPQLRQLSASVPVLCFAGDFGAFPPDNMHLFAQTDSTAPGLRYFGTGLGDDARDAFLTVRVPAQGPPEVRAYELSSGRELDLALYDHESWRVRWFPNGLPQAVYQFLLR